MGKGEELRISYRDATKRLTTCPMATTTHRTTNHSAVLAAAVNAMPEGEDGADRNGPPRTSHHTATPGSTNVDSGFLNADAMTAAEPSNTSAAALAIASA